jgi:hypothetical protein
MVRTTAASNLEAGTWIVNSYPPSIATNSPATSTPSIVAFTLIPSAGATNSNASARVLSYTRAALVQ